MPDSPLLDGLPVEQRLALAYAPASSHALFAALFALDARLAGVVRSAREPLLAQLRLAWWRDRLVPGGGGNDPVLLALTPLCERGFDLVKMVDGWEALLGERLDEPAARAFAAGRGAAMAALAGLLGAAPEPAARAGEGWAIADLGARLSDPAERSIVQDLLAAHDWQRTALPRTLRPLTVLHGLARRSRGQRPLVAGPGSLLAAIRLGLSGR